MGMMKRVQWYKTPNKAHWSIPCADEPIGFKCEKSLTRSRWLDKYWQKQ